MATIYDLPADCIGIIMSLTEPCTTVSLLFIRMFRRHALPFRGKGRLLLQNAVYDCVSKGYMGLLKWFVGYLRYIPDVYVLETVGEAGQFEMLKWLYCRWAPRAQHDKGRILRGCALGGRLDIVKWLTEEFAWYRPSALTFSAAAASGSLELLEYLSSKGCPRDETACSMAAERGHLHVLKWLRGSNPCQWDERACQRAVEGGQFEVLKWLRSYSIHASTGGPCPWGESTCASAAEAGRLDILEWVREGEGSFRPDGTYDPCPWDCSTCYFAMVGGHLDLLKWVRSEERLGGQCPWIMIYFVYLSSKSCTETLKWALENGCPCSDLFREKIIEGYGGPELDQIRKKIRVN